MRLTVKLKLGLAFGAIIAMSAVTAFIGVNSLESLNGILHELLQGPVHRVQLANQLYTDLIGISRAERSILAAPAAAIAKHYDDEIVSGRKALSGHLTELEALEGAEGRSQLATFKETWERYQPLQDKFRDAATHDQAQAAQLSYDPLKKLVDDGKAELSQVIAIDQRAMNQAENGAAQQYQTAKWVLMSVLLGSSLLAVGTAVWIAVGISRGLRKAILLADAVSLGDLSQEIAVRSNDEIRDVVDALNRMTTNLRATATVADSIADGDLTAAARRLSDKDALGMALERMLGKLRGVVTDSSTAAENVSSGSQELSSSAIELSQGATEQAAAAEEASASMEQMAANIKQNADNAAQTEKIARQSALDAQKSGEAVGRSRRRARPSRCRRRRRSWRRRLNSCSRA
jgi:methyl-accepting chemotaxis protein